MTVTTAMLRQAVNDAYARHHVQAGGKNASYIPFLANVPSHLAGLAVVTVGGEVITAGDAEYPFAIESISKMCTLALAMEDHGPATVRAKVGADATGLPFNSVMALELHRGRPLSPLVNAGAMSTVSLVKAANAEARWQRILDMQSRLAGRPIQLSDEVNRSEQDSNFHNRAIAWLLYSANTMYADPMQTCDVYTRQCSTLVDAVALATMAGTLAAAGRNPLSGEQVIKAGHTPHILAEMTMEGLYGHSGTWAYEVGLPGKSGVGGGLLAVVPGVMGIAAFSPPLDTEGNSVRGQKMVADLAAATHSSLYRQSACCG